MTDPKENTELSEEMKRVLRKYPSVGAAVKANDAPALSQILDYLKEQDRLNVDDLNTLLVKGASAMKVETAQILTSFGAEVGDLAEDLNAAQTALLAKNSALLFYFIDQKMVDVDFAERGGLTLLMDALQSEQYEVADGLLERGSNINKTSLMMTGGNTALHLAASQGSFQSIIWLIENGADPTVQNTEGKLSCEMIPEMDANSKEWDMDAMFDALEDYRGAFEKGEEFEIPHRLREMAFLESTPVSAGEAMAKAMASGQKEAMEAKEESILPSKPKKIGF